MRDYRVITSSLRMRPGIILSMLPILTFICFSSSRAQEVITLQSGRSVECEIGGEAKCAYQISMSAGQYTRVTVKQIGIDVSVELAAADGRASVDFDSEIKLTGEQRIDFVATAAGTYRLTIKPKYQKLPPGRCEIRLVEERSATENEKLLHEGRRLRTEARRLYDIGNYDDALPLAEKAVALQEQAGADQSAQTRALLMLALIVYVKGNYSRAGELAQRSLVTSERETGSHHSEVAHALNLLALICRAKGDQARAIALVQRALSILESAFGVDHPELVTTLTDLALLYRDQGDFVNAEPLYKRALATSERAYGEDSYETGRAVDMIANFYRELGDYQEAEPLYLRALAIWEKTRGVNHPAFAVTLNNLANLYRNQGAYEKAEPLYQRALSIKEKTLGPDHPDVARYRENLGFLYYQQGAYAKAEPLYLSALATWEKVGPNHPMVGRNLRNLAVLYHALKDYQKAEACYHRALNIYETTFGPNYYFLASILTGLAKTSLAQDKFAEALNYQAHANAIADYNLNLNLAIGSERQKMNYLSTLPEELNRTISLHTRFGANDAGAAELALTTLLQRKGRVQDALSDSLAALRSRLGAQAQAFLDELNDVTSQLARLVLNGRLNASLAEYQKRIKTLEDKREALEAEISRRSAGYYQPQPATLDAVRSALPDNAALVEFAVYRPLDPKASGNRPAFGNPNYVVYVLRRRGQVQGKDLGPVKEIDQAIDSFRSALRDPKRQDVQKLARIVNDSVIKPISTLFGDATQLLISPDGALNLIPFEALVDEEDRYLVSRYSISYLTSGRDLLRLQLPRSSLSAPMVVANPLFGEPEATQTSRADAPKVNKVALNRRQDSTAVGPSVSYMYFSPLIATELEAQTIKSLFTDADVKTGLQANESWLKHAAAPRILHIATHGFFLQDPKLAADKVSANGTGDDKPQISTRGIDANVRIDNPLLRSGLALAGANLLKSGDDDGILTALEASGLNLWGTKLVTLSGCDTGLGEVKIGEGVYGLRRAFVLAGTETLVMSLWPVSDYATRELMTGYYDGLKRGLGRREALREVQLAMLGRKDRRHPFYWASFIQSGEWANLDGKR